MDDADDDDDNHDDTDAAASVHIEVCIAGVCVPCAQCVRPKVNGKHLLLSAVPNSRIDVDVHDEEDNQKAAMLIDHLVRVAPGRQGAALPLADRDPFNALFEKVGPVIVELNPSIEKEAYEIKYRFKV